MTKPTDPAALAAWQKAAAKSAPGPKKAGGGPTGAAKTVPGTKPLSQDELDALAKAALPDEATPTKLPPPPPPIKRTDPQKTPAAGSDTSKPKPNPY